MPYFCPVTDLTFRHQDRSPTAPVLDPFGSLCSSVDFVMRKNLPKGTLMRVQMKLLPGRIEEKIPAMRSTEGQDDPTVQVKFFTPDSSWTWYVLEYDPTDRLFYGLVDGFEKELGYFSLDELEQTTGPMGLHIERDQWFKPCPLSEVRS